MTIHKFWSSDEVDRLKANAETLTLRELMKILPGRSLFSIRGKLIDYGLKAKYQQTTLRKSVRPWTGEEEQQLLELRGTCSTDEIAARLNRSKQSVRGKLTLMGLKPLVYANKREWTKEEDAILMRMLEKHNLVYIAKVLKRGDASVGHRKFKLGLKSFTGTYSAKKAAAATGYAISTIYRARDGLKMVWRKVRRGADGQFIITHDQLEILTAWLMLEGTGLEHGLQPDMKILHLDRYLEEHGYKNKSQDAESNYYDAA